MVEIIIIAAITEKRVIGKGSEIPWHISEDFQLFKKKTTGNVIIMGSKTYRSIGKALPNRHNVVLTKNKIKLPDATVLNDFEKAITHSKKYAVENNCKIFIIGGGSIYTQGLKFANKLYLSLVKKDYEGDVFFPEFKKKWKRNVNQDIDYKDFTFTIWEKKKKT